MSTENLEITRILLIKHVFFVRERVLCDPELFGITFLSFSSYSVTREK